jgi:hypothetical protein
MQLTFWIIGIFNLANGLWMLFAPEGWYLHLPAGVPDTGAFNAHFVRDIGAAFTTIGMGFCVAASLPAYRRAIVVGAACFYGLHAAVHVTDMLGGRLHEDHWLIDLPGVLLPAAVLLIWCLPHWWRKE